MKKIIAMLLCVAMVAALSVAAFADLSGIAKLADGTAVSSVEELVASKTQKAPEGTVKAYAESLAAAKKAAGDAKDAYAKMIANVKNAALAAQYNALEKVFEQAATNAEKEIALAINNYLAEVQIALG